MSNTTKLCSIKESITFMFSFLFSLYMYHLRFFIIRFLLMQFKVLLIWQCYYEIGNRIINYNYVTSNCSADMYY